MNNGWIKIHRRMVDWEWYLDENTFRVFLHLLLQANHEPKKWKGHTIEIGQRITSLAHLSQELRLGVQQIRTALNKLKATNDITIKPTNKYTLITIVNWSKYQKEDIKLTNKLTNEQQTTNKQLTTNKNVKKDKNVKKEPASQDDALIPQIIDLFKEVNPSHQRLYGMPPQRRAIERLIKQHGFEKLKGMVAFLPKSNAAQYAPTITTPVQFEQKLGELIAWSQKQKSITNNKGRGIA